MEIGEILYPRTRADWRAWLRDYHASSSEIWLRRFRIATGKQSITYDELVEEALCFGWIDGIVKRLDEESTVQRITPRRARSYLSELNRQRAWILIERGLMTAAGLAALGDKLGSPSDPWEIPAWIYDRLTADPVVWATFTGFPVMYQRLKISWVTEAGQLRREEMEKRLANLIRKTRAGTMYGTVPITDPALGVPPSCPSPTELV